MRNHEQHVLTLKENDRFMKPLHSFFVAASILAVCVGCASPTQQAPIPDLTKSIENPAKSRIYLIRPANFGGAVATLVTDGTRPIGQTGAQSYLCWERDPGEVTIGVKAESVCHLTLNVEAGHVYYVMQYVEWGMWSERCRLEQIDEARATELLKTCKSAKR